jgi:hypothetical protein
LGTCPHEGYRKDAAKVKFHQPHKFVFCKSPTDPKAPNRGALAEFFFGKQMEKGLIFFEEKRIDVILVKNDGIKGRQREDASIQEHCNELQKRKHESKDLKSLFMRYQFIKISVNGKKF